MKKIIIPFSLMLVAVVGWWWYTDEPGEVWVEKEFICGEDRLAYKGIYITKGIGVSLSHEKLLFNGRPLSDHVLGFSFPANLAKLEELTFKKMSDFQYLIDTSNVYVSSAKYSPEEFEVISSCVVQYESEIEAASVEFTEMFNRKVGHERNQSLDLNAVIYGSYNDGSLTKEFSCPNSKQFLLVEANGNTTFGNGPTGSGNYYGEELHLIGGPEGGLYPSFFRNFEIEKSALSECTYQGENFYQHFEISEQEVRLSGNRSE